jgi:hypothetical protein
MSGIDMNTSDLSGNDSSDGSGKIFFFIINKKRWIGILEGQTQMGDDNSFDEPFRMRSPECKIEFLSVKQNFYFVLFCLQLHHIENTIILVL